MTTPLDRLFGRLPGAWLIARSIDDDRLGAGRFDGRATFAPQAGGALLYEERGELRIGDWRGPAYRRWLYRRHADVLEVLYPDGGALLHRFDFAGAYSAMHTHLCGEDRYEAIFTLSDTSFTIGYTVDGPAKRYRLRSDYAPAPAPAR